MLLVYIVLCWKMIPRGWHSEDAVYCHVTKLHNFTGSHPLVQKYFTLLPNLLIVSIPSTCIVYPIQPLRFLHYTTVSAWVFLNSFCKILSSSKIIASFTSLPLYYHTSCRDMAPAMPAVPPVFNS
jgi:hypothetical protein